MRNVYKFLRASILILILVGGTYFIAQEYSAGIKNAVNTSAGGQSLTKETITNLGDVLATVEAEIAGGAGSEKTNDTVKSDYQPVQGTGQLVEDSKSQQTDTTPAASYDFRKICIRTEPCFRIHRRKFMTRCTGQHWN